MSAICLYAPPIAKRGRWLEGTHDSELLYLGQHLFDHGHVVQVLDHFAHPPAERTIVDVIDRRTSLLVVDLWKNEILLNGQLDRVLEEVEVARRVCGEIDVAFIGHIASSIKEHLEAKAPGYFVVSQRRNSAQKELCGNPILRDIQDYYHRFPTLTKEYLLQVSPDVRKDDVVSVLSSRGCKKSCSFCSYNNHLHGWSYRSGSLLASDIILMHNLYGVKKFALSDNNFGVSRYENALRLRQLVASIPVISDIEIRLNISADGLSAEVVDLMKKCGCRALLLGTESFDANTLKYVFNKKLDVEHMLDMIDYAQHVGLTPILSHILFHPWTTADSLQFELGKMRVVGRHLFIHFIANSVLQVVPNTRMEKMVSSAGLLESNGLNRGFRFKHANISLLHGLLVRHFCDHYQQSETIQQLARLRVSEWSLLEQLGF